MADNVREFVVSSLNQFNTYLNENILSQYAGYSYVYDAYSYVLQAIEDNEYVTAYGLIQLNDRINGIDLSAYALKTTLNSYVTYTNAKKWYPSYAYVQTYYPTYTYLNEKLTNIDLSTYVSKTELSNASYITYSYAFNEYPSYTYLDEKLANIDLSTYVSKEELSSQSYLTEIPNTYPTYSAISEMGYITSIPSEYVTQTVLSNQSYAGYAYIYDSYAYIMTKINALELASGGGGSGTSAEGGITAISFNGTPASITGSVATIVAPINDPAIEITMNGETYSFTLNQSTAYSINLGTVLTQHQSLTDYVTKTDLSNAGYITSGLPSVTSSDNGKILMVVNGAWSLVLPSTIYSGNATPSNSNGNNGDIYLQS